MIAAEATELRALFLANQSGPQPHGVPLMLQSHGFTPMSQSVFDYTRLAMFEGHNKHMWLDVSGGWCRLCQEPISSFASHIADRDHISLVLFLHLYVNYPRTWRTEWVLDGAPSSCIKRLQWLHSAMAKYRWHAAVDQLHTEADARRREELEALLWHLASPPDAVLTNILNGTGEQSIAMSGERMFKHTVAKLCATRSTKGMQQVAN